MEKKRILIVEDEAAMRFSLETLILRLKHEPIIACNGRDALEIITTNLNENTPIDLLVCDIQMPELTGDKLIQNLRELGIKIPVLVITGFGDKELIITLMRLGCRDFLDKPFLPQDLEAHIQALLDTVDAEQKEKTQIEYFAKVGEYARSAIHDVNNVLGAAIGFSDLILYDIPQDHPSREHVNKVISASNRAADICRDLLRINPAESDSKRSRTNLNILVERVVKLLSDILPETIKVELKAPYKDLWLNADAARLQHALLNLGFNAADAIVSEGRITYAMGLIDLGESGTVIEITVTDTGKGITPDILEKIFENGFTTRKAGNGIGLANVKKIVGEHDGKISVTSKVNEGSCFSLAFTQQKKTDNEKTTISTLLTKTL